MMGSLWRLGLVVVGVSALAGFAWGAGAGTAAGAKGATGRPGWVVFDFESGDLQGWRVVEGKFDKVVCDREFFHHQNNVKYNKQGKYFVSTLELSNGTPSDGMTGILESPVFVLKGRTASFLVGGGSHPDTYVALYTEDGREVLRASGKNTQTMQRVTWDVSALVGKRVFLRIVDQNQGGWGHETFDDFAAEGEIDEKATAARPEAIEREKRERAEREVLAAFPTVARSLRLAIGDLTETFGERYPKGPAFLERLTELERRFERASLDERKGIVFALCAFQREALAANPLVCGQPILFVVRFQYHPDHHNTETMFQTGEINTNSFKGGGALKTIDFADGGKVKTLITVPDGVARDPDVSFDGKRVLFSMRKGIEDDYHLYEMNADGTGLRALTSGAGITDIDPLYLPDGRIAFTATREPKYCMCNRHIMGNLFRMDADGANIVQIGHSTLHEGHGALTPDGRIMYDRWEYVDRNFGDAQGTWTCNPDGTNHAVYYGNNTKSPGAVLDARIIPGTHRMIATFSSCHDRPWGALAVVDQALGVDGRPPVLRTWPASAMDLVMVGGYDTFKKVEPKYEDPFPLSDKYFLCARQAIGEQGSLKGEQMGIFLLDVFGNEVLLHTEAPGCFDPMPLAARPRPPVIPDRIRLDSDEGYFYVQNVYNGTGMERVKPGTVKFLRVVESPEKRFWTRTSWQGSGTQAPAMAWNDFNNKRILGTAPVRADGSAYFAVPADRFVYFQLLDGDGMMVQTMRSGTISRPGETTGCVGCHENRLSAVVNTPTMSERRPADRLTPWHGEPRLFGYVSEVQPVFDRHCVKCHDFGKPGAAKVVLAGDLTLAFNVSYTELRRRDLVKVVGAGPAEILPPYSWGAHASKLVDVLRKGHKDVKLNAEEFDRIVTWVDINAPYYPDYASEYPENLYGRSPLDAGQLKELSALTGVDLTKQQPEPLVCFNRPEVSPCLAGIKDKNGPDYRKAAAIIQAGKEMLAQRPRRDMPGAPLVGIEAQREEKYEHLAQRQAEARAAILKGERKYW